MHIHTGRCILFSVQLCELKYIENISYWENIFLQSIFSILGMVTVYLGMIALYWSKADKMEFWVCMQVLTKGQNKWRYSGMTPFILLPV
jgi:hypothetical protein